MSTPDHPLGHGEYRAAVLACHMAANLLAQHDLGAVLEAIERAHGIGPILDPTLYRSRSKLMDEDAEVVRAAMKLAKYGRSES